MHEITPHFAISELGPRDVRNSHGGKELVVRVVAGQDLALRTALAWAFEVFLTRECVRSLDLDDQLSRRLKGSVPIEANWGGRDGEGAVMENWASSLVHSKFTLPLPKSMCIQIHPPSPCSHGKRDWCGKLSATAFIEQERLENASFRKIYLGSC